MKPSLPTLFFAGAILSVGSFTAEAQVRFHFGIGGDDWCGPSSHHFAHPEHVPIFSPWSPAGYLPYHDPYCEPISRVVVPSIRYTVVPSSRYIVPSTPTIPATPELSPTARVASSRPIYSSRRPTNTEEISSAFLAQAKEDFRRGDYDAALYNVGEALGLTPNDPDLHQLRALGLFAQGRYDDASGIVKRLSEGGTTWNWESMIAHYPSKDVYERQMRRLEHHVDSNPNSSNPRFLLGYHYQIGGYLSEARMMFEQASSPPVMAAKSAPPPAPKPAPAVRTEPKPKRTQPEKVDEAIMAATVSPPPSQPEPEPGPSIAGTWRSVTDDGKTITLEIGRDGKFSWEYEGAPEESTLRGDWTLADDRKLDLLDKDVPLSGAIEMEGDNTMRFVLEGTPDDDPGLVFERM